MNKWNGKAVKHMNWSDYAVIGIIGVFALAGLFKGLIMSVYRLISYVLCIFLSIKLSPVLARLVQNTPIYESIKRAIVNNLEVWSRNAASAPQAAEAGAKGAEQVVGAIPLPDILRSSVLSKLPAPSEMLDIGSILDAVGQELAARVISVMSLVVVFFILQIVFAFAGRLLNGVARLPLLRQVNMLGGLILGALQGILAVYILFAVLMLFHSNPGFAPVFNGIESSMIASMFYRDNIIINFLFPPVTG